MPGSSEYGEWNQKGATLTNGTAEREYGVNLEFIKRGVKAGKLEYRRAVIWGNPCVRLLRRQLEAYIREELGADRLSSEQTRTELRKVKREISRLKKRLAELEARKGELERG